MTGEPAVAVGKITRAHGVRGEVAVLVLSEVQERFEPGVELSAEGRGSLAIETTRRDRGRLLVKFRGVEDREPGVAAEHGEMGVEGHRPGPFGHPGGGVEAVEADEDVRVGVASLRGAAGVRAEHPPGEPGVLFGGPAGVPAGALLDACTLHPSLVLVNTLHAGIWAPSGVSVPTIILKSVVLPAPLGPMMPTMPPRGRLNVMSSKSRFSP